MNIARTAWALALVVVALSSCSTAPKPGSVQREWNRTLREMGINPIFPPREDVQVGDVYARRGNPSDPRLAVKNTFVPIDLWVATIPVTQELEALYLSRTVMPRTEGDATHGYKSESLAWGTRSKPVEASGGTVEASGPKKGQHEVDTAETPSTASVFDQRDLGRLRTVAFPDFMSMTITKGDLRGLVPVQALQVAFGAHWSDDHQVSVKIPSAESCGLPLEAMRAKLDADGDQLLEASILSPSTLRWIYADQSQWAAVNGNLSQEQREAIGSEPYVNLDVITEVYYARAIEVSISNKKDRGATIGTPQANGGATAAAPAEAPTEPATTKNALDRAKDLNASLAEIQGQTLPGGRIEFVSVSDSSVSMRRTFDQPIAIGFRGIQVRLDPKDGRIVSMGAASNRAANTTGGDAVAVSNALKKAVASVLALKDSILVTVTTATSSVEGAVLGRLALDIERLGAEKGPAPSVDALRSALIHRAADIASALGAELSNPSDDTVKLVDEVRQALAAGRFKLDDAR